MIELILTNTLDSAPILQKLKNTRSSAKQNILIVPDRFSLSYQKSTLEYLGIKGTFDIEVSSFSRLADKLLTDKRRILDKQSEIMLLRKVIEENKSQLLCFAKSGVGADFADDMYAAISQIRNSNVSVSRLAEAAEKLPPRIANKTKDIVKIYRAYVEYLQDGFGDGTSKLQALADCIAQGALNDCNVYISDFMSFSEVEYDVIRQIFINSLNTYISLVDSSNDNSHVFPYEVKARLVSLAHTMGLKLQESRYDQRLAGDADIIYRGLYSYKSVDGERDGKVKVYSCKDINGEIKSVARKINELVGKGSARYMDFAIVCCDFKAYAPYIKSVFDSFGIPFYADIKQQLSAQAASKFIMGALRVRIDGFSRSETVRFAKQSFVGLDYDDVCVFENYCLKYGIDYTRFLSPFALGGEDVRSVAERVRSKIVNEVLLLGEDGRRVSDYVADIKNFIQVTDCYSLADSLSERQAERGFEELSSLTSQSLRKFIAILDHCESMLGDSAMSMEEFYWIISSAIASVEMSNVPLYADSVFIGESSQSRYENIDYMFIVGANSGKFPAEHTDSGIVSEREYSAWEKQGIDVQPDCRRRNSKERLNALMILTRANKSLDISYPTRGARGEELTPSATTQYICKLLDESAIDGEEPDRDWGILDYARYVSSEQNVMSELLGIAAMVKNGLLEYTGATAEVADILYELACRSRGKAYVDALLEGREEESLTDNTDVMFNGNRTSVSQFEKYFKCPFLHFNENVLKLKRREIDGLEVKDTGILLHAVLQKYFSLKDCADKSAVEIPPVVEDLFMKSVEENPDYSYLLNEKDHAMKLRQLVAQATYAVVNLVENMQVSKFRPAMLEASFGAGYPVEKDLRGMEIFNGYRKLNFEGVIDRIDTYRDRAIIIDYKSKYNIEFKAYNVLYGDRIQLFVYLNALRINRNITPQGAFYLLMNNRFIKNDDKSSKRFMHRGFVNGEEKLAADMDNGFVADGDFVSNVYPLKRKVNKSGAQYLAQTDGEAISSKEFDGIGNYVMRLTEKAAKEIEEGYVAKSPLNIGGDEDVKACRYCDYASVCARSKVKVRNVKKATMRECAESFGGNECRESIGQKNSLE